jgi:hypothetical protein
LAEPVWLAKPVPLEVLRALNEGENSFLTEAEMRHLMEECGFQVLENFVSSKEDWELYVRPVYTAMHGIIENKGDLADEARKVMNGFKAEYDAACQHLNVILWVAKTH